MDAIVARRDVTTPNGAIITEHIATSFAFSSWAHARLYEYVDYKAAATGIETVQVDPRYTSQRCSKCGYIARENRPHGRKRTQFQCRDCGYQVHPDYTAVVRSRRDLTGHQNSVLMTAKNVGFRHFRDRRTSGGGGAPVGVRVNSGIVNANGKSVPAGAIGDRGSPR